jgi:hypothetical protein
LEKLAVSASTLSTRQWNGRANFVVGVTLSVGAFARLTTSQIRTFLAPHRVDPPVEKVAGEHPRGSAGRNSCPGAHLRSACPSTETNDRSAGRANGEKQRQNAIAITFLPAIAAFHSAKCLSLKIKELDARSHQPVSRAMLGAKHGGPHAFFRSYFAASARSARGARKGHDSRGSTILAANR